MPPRPTRGKERDNTSLHDVSSTEDAVRVTSHDGSYVGRFSKHLGIDVHRTAAVQLADADQILHCTHE